MVMRYILHSLILLLLLSGCKKQDNGSFIWEKEMGPGKLVFVTSTPDSMFAACGQSGSNPVLYLISRKGKIIDQYKSVDNGVFTSVIADTGGYYVAGLYGSEMTLLRLNRQMEEEWTKKEQVSISEGQAKIIMESPESLVAALSAVHSDYGTEPSVLILMRIDTSGTVQSVAEKNPAYFNSVSSLVISDTFIYTAVMVGSPGSRSRAEVAKYSSDFDLIWNKSLFNNPGFGAGSLSIINGTQNSLLVSGYTELPGDDVPVINSWVASLTREGVLSWKSYLEVSNTGEGLLENEGTLFLLNKNCMILNLLDPSGGEVTGRKKVFYSCDSYKTGSKALAFAPNYDGHLLLTGERDGNIYMLYTNPE